MSASTAWPALVFSRYFLSQMSWEAGCIGISPSLRARSAVAVLTASRRTVLMPVLSPRCAADRAAACRSYVWVVPGSVKPMRIPRVNLRRRGLRSHLTAPGGDPMASRGLCSWVWVPSRLPARLLRRTPFPSVFRLLPSLPEQPLCLGPSRLRTTRCSGGGRPSYARAERVSTRIAHLVATCAEVEFVKAGYRRGLRLWRPRRARDGRRHGTGDERKRAPRAG